MDDDQDVSGLVQLARTPLPERHALLTSALSLPTLDPLAAVSALRREYPDLDPGLCSALVTQQQLLLAGADRGLIDATGLWMTTPVGLEQASRPQVAFRRASLLAAAGVRSVVDATAGIGIDSHAFARRGLHVVAVEKDPVTSEVCAANLTATLSDVDAATKVITADATEPDLLGSLAQQLPAPVAVFVDPSRRGSTRPVDGSRARPERDPERWSPPWSFVDSLRSHFDFVAAKAPGSFVPSAAWACEWLGVRDHIVECSVYSTTPPAFLATHQATLLSSVPDSEITYAADMPPGSSHPSSHPSSHASSAQQPPAGPLEGYLGEPHPVFRHSLAALCGTTAHVVHPDSHWITSAQPTIEGVRWYRLLQSVPVTQLANAAHDHGIDAIAIKCRESRRSLSELRESIGLPDGNRYAVVLAGGLNDALLVERVHQQTRAHHPKATDVTGM